MYLKSPKGHSSEAQVTAFEDSWTWGEQAEQEYAELLRQPNTDVAEMIAAMRKFLNESDVMAYLVMMANRLLELHRVLKPTGSLYLHCDPTASHYLKIVMDAIFGPENLLNEIIWRRTAVKGDVRRKFGAVHDTVLAYTKTQAYKYNIVYGEMDDEYHERFRFNDQDGRGPYQSAPLDGPNPRPNLTYEFKGYPSSPKDWSVSQRGYGGTRQRKSIDISF